jgi:hypothetical protein
VLLGSSGDQMSFNTTVHSGVLLNDKRISLK